MTTTTCTGRLTPSIDAHLIARLGFAIDKERTRDVEEIKCHPIDNHRQNQHPETRTRITGGEEPEAEDPRRIGREQRTKSRRNCRITRAQLRDRCVGRGIGFLRQTQCDHGAWPVRWGVNNLYGTWHVVQGLRTIDFPIDDMKDRCAVALLKRVHQPSVAWGESCASYDDPKLAGIGTPTASQTAWALLGLIAAGEQNSPEVHAGIRWLLRTQNEDGGWTEEPFTGTGFPRVFYLKYHMYPVYFPLMALGRYLAAVSRQLSGVNAAEYRFDGAHPHPPRKGSNLNVPADG